MAAPGYTYPSGLFNEDHLPPTGSPPPPPYHIVVADRPHRALASHPLDQSSPILTARGIHSHQHGTQLQGHIAPGSPTSTYAVLASRTAGAQGQVYHHFVQVPYLPVGTRYSPPLPPGFPPPRSPPLPSLLPHQTSAHLVPQLLPTHTGRDPGPAPSLSIQPKPPVPAQQPNPAPTSTPTTTPTATATATDCTEPPWTPEQDRLLLLRKDEHKSHSDISADLEDVFQVKRDADAIAKRLKQLRARNKVWSDDQLKEAIQKAMQQLSPVLQQELTQASAIPNAADITSSTADHAQLADIRLVVRLELDEMVREGNLASDMEQRLLEEQRERSARYTTAMRRADRGREQEREQVDREVDGNASGEQVEDYEIL